MATGPETRAHWTAEWAAYYGIRAEHMNDLRAEEIKSVLADLPLRRRATEALIALAEGMAQGG